MAEILAKRSRTRAPTHPGENIREDVLPSLNMAVTAASNGLGISQQQLHRILSCTHSITIEMALRIGKFVGTGPGLWLRMQQEYDLWHKEKEIHSELENIETVRKVS